MTQFEMRNHTFVFFGEDSFSLAVLRSLLVEESGLSALAVIILAPVSTSGEQLVNYCRKNEIPVIQIASFKDEKVIKLFAAMEYDFILSAHFQRIIPRSIFGRAKLNALNLHPSLLPYYRGMSPQHWPIVNGDKKTGVTVHVMEEDVDVGRIIDQVVINLSEDIYIHQLQKEFLKVYPRIMRNSVNKCIDGYQGIEQEVIASSYYGKISTHDRTIVNSDSLKTAYGKIRAFSVPYAGAIYGDIEILRANRMNHEEFTSLYQTFGIGFCQLGDVSYLILNDGGLSHLKWRKNEN
ncbi:Methionyl-tRNA formyltransferase [Gammaproteobacteria bacterium MOLA455]|nr:Methionyl-tRNA formyltransferase [Gammaproteobacteria bacterium MOLA455]